MATQPNISPYAVYGQAADNATKIFFFDVVGGSLIWWLVGVWRFAAIAGFGLGVLLTILEGLHVAAVVKKNRELAPIALAEGFATPEDNQWFRRAGNVRVVSVAISGVILLILFNRLW